MGGREEWVVMQQQKEMDLMEQRNSFLRFSTPPRSTPCVACILVFKPVRALSVFFLTLPFVRALGLRHSPCLKLLGFFEHDFDEVLMI